MAKKLIKEKAAAARNTTVVTKPQKRPGAVSTSRPATKVRAVRGHAKASILSSLATGPKTRAQLIKAGQLSAPVFYLNLKQLKETNQITVEGRKGLIRLVGTAATVTPEVQSKSLPVLRPETSSRVAVIPQYVSGDLHDALEAVNARFVAMDRVGEKLHTLEQLSRTLPGPVAEVLKLIHGDLLRLSPARSRE